MTTRRISALALATTVLLGVPAMPATAAPSTPTPAVKVAGSGSSVAKVRVLTAKGKVAAFTTPTGNITCVLERYTSSRSTVSCEILTKTFRSPRRPTWCDVDWGHRISMDRGRPEFECYGDVMAGDTTLEWGNPDVSWFNWYRDIRVRREAGLPHAGLRYGYALRSGDITCTSTKDGVTCTNRNGHGLRLSKAAYRTW